MRIEGAIHPTGDAAVFGREAWLRLVGTRPEFRQPPKEQGTNPFTGEPMILRPTPDVACVMVDGREVGMAYWSVSDEPMVIVSIEESAIPLLREWTTALGGEFRRHSQESEA